MKGPCLRNARDGGCRPSVWRLWIEPVRESKAEKLTGLLDRDAARAVVLANDLPRARGTPPYERRSRANRDDRLAFGRIKSCREFQRGRRQVFADDRLWFCRGCQGREGARYATGTEQRGLN